MKIKDLPITILAIIGTMFLFIPFPQKVFEICYYVICTFGFVFIGIALYCLAKPKYPKVLPRMILIYSLWFLAMYIGATRLIILFPLEHEEIKLISFCVDWFFIKNPIVGYSISVVSIVVSYIACYSIKINDDETMKGGVTSLRGTNKASTFVFVASIIACTILGVKKNDMGVWEALKNYAPYCCAQFIYYEIAFVIACVGIAMICKFCNSNNSEE